MDIQNAKQLEEMILFFTKEGSKEVHDAIISIHEDPNSIPLFLECLQSTKEDKVKFFCIIIIKKMIIRDRDTKLSIEIQQMLFNAITKQIEEEKNDQIRDYMGEFITYLRLNPDDRAESTKIACTEFTFHLLQTNKVTLISTAFYIMYNLYASLSSEQKQEVLQTLLPIAVENLTNDEFQCRCNSMLLLSNILYQKDFEIDEEDQNLSSIFEHLSKSILINANRINTEKFNSDEVKAIYSLANVVIEKCDSFQLEYIQQFAEIFLNFINNTEVDPMIRYNSLENMEHLFKTAIDQIKPLQQPILEGVINLAIEITTNEPDTQDVLLDLIIWLQNSLGPRETYQIFYKVAISLIETNDIIKGRLGFDIISSVIYVSPDSANDDIDAILDQIFNYLEPQNITDEEGNVLEFIPISCSQVISIFCEINPNEMSAQAETLIHLLFNYLNIKYCMNAIIDLTEITDLSPDKCEEYLQQTLKLIESTLSDSGSSTKIDIEELVKMLINFLEMINNIDEKIYPKIIPLVQSMIESPNVSPSQKMIAANLFGKLIIICPQSATDEIDNFIKFSLEQFSSDDSETFLYIVEFLDTVLINQSKFITPYMKEIFEALMNLLNQSDENINKLKQIQNENENEEDGNDNEEEDEENEYLSVALENEYSLQQSILNLLCTICSIYPSQTKGYFEDIYKLHEKKINLINEKLVIGVIQDFDNLSDAYLSENCDTTPLLMFLISNLDNPNIILLGYDIKLYYLKVMKELWKEISIVMSNAGTQLVSRSAEEISEILSTALNKKKNIYNEEGDVEEIAFSLRVPIFAVLDIFVEELGSECHQYIQKFIEPLFEMANKPHIKSQCYAARSLAKIAATLPSGHEDGNKFIELALQVAMKNYKVRDISTRTCSLTTLNTILNFRPDLIDPIKSDLLEFTTSIIQKNLAGSDDDEYFLNECVILFFSMIQVFELVDEENIELIRKSTNIVKMDYNSPDLIPLSSFARFIIKIDKENFMEFNMFTLLYILSSSHMILRKISKDNLTEYAKEMSALSGDEIIQMLNWNYTKFDILQNNISNILGGQES